MTDPDGDAVTCTFRVYSNEREPPASGDGLGRFAPDFKTTLASGAEGVFLRSERNGRAQGRHYTVVITADNQEELMLPGMTALVEIVTARKDEVLQVPNAALRFEMPTEFATNAHLQLQSDYSSSVWEQTTAGEFEIRSLTLGYSDGNHSEVKSGDLNVGDRVVIGYSN